ncbi:B3/B4 domain-containing protein [Pantoea rwandensis]|uniref:B3/B4 tRNA-binding domain-containing protein n=1 Tax=Pantoea rwandensis TaxID=1076550 RepID=A0A1X1D345_9GAMM|nr:B3/4 domain-containing protein [Pantoea rwandensis]ORM71054.1 hypothetical protein HA51_03950 [Pantoea rwandensis]
MFSVIPSIDDSIAQIGPGFRAISIVAEAAPLTHPEVAEEFLERACKSVVAGEMPWADAHLDAWSEAFKKFGAKPKRTPCSAEALRKRVIRDGFMAGIDPVVDLYNAISIHYAIPVGGENFGAYVGQPRLTIAEGTETFDTIKDGIAAEECPEPGEVVWRDEAGVTCRRWNWRQGVRTRLSAEATQMWFILESLPAMPLEMLHEAGDELIRGLQLMMPGTSIKKELIGFDIE